jgi:predicted metal-dependent RNase
MIRQINPIYRKLAQFKVARDAFTEVTGEGERRILAHGAQTSPKIIVTTSGMLTGGPAIEYAQQLLPDARNRIILTGFQDEGAPSRALRDLSNIGVGPRPVELTDESGEVIRFTAARAAEEVHLSSHADEPGLIEYAGRLKPNIIALVHGEPSAQEHLASRLRHLHKRAEVHCGPSELPIP